MCGIAGIVDHSRHYDLPELIRLVNDEMQHRGPDAAALFVEDEAALGHRRLSIIDLSEAANQPFHDDTGRYVIVFNGEIYNFQDVKRQLPDYPFRTSSDTEVVIAAFAKWGPACLDLLKGMFALAIWDRVEKTLFLARDRFGVKPLYYYRDGGLLIFASEIRAILASKLVPRKVNRPALAEYLRFQSFTAPVTLVEDILQLPAGTHMTWKQGQIEQKVYWDVTRRKQEIAERTLPEIHRRIRELLYASVERRLVSDVPLGAFLSGGIDSGAIVAIMSQVNKKTTNAFTVGFEEKEYDELPYAEIVAKKFGVQHNKVLLRADDFLNKLPFALNAMDTPSGDGPNTYVVAEAIRKSGITVALSGVGGDELFAGYPIFRQFQSVKGRGFDATRLLRKGLAAVLPSADPKWAKWKGLLEAGSSRIADIYPVLRQIQNPHTIRRFLPAQPASPASGPMERLLKDKQPCMEQFGLLSQVSMADYLGYTQSVLLKDTDQMSMAVSLEVREPFFDHDLVEYVLNVPDNSKQPLFPKKLLVDSLAGLLPDEIVFRKKQGFVLPYDIWLRNELRAFCADRINRLSERGLFSSRALKTYWDDYVIKKPGIRSTDIWIFVTLEHWLEKNGVS